MNSIKETLAKIVFLLVACVSILAVALICIFLFANGIPAMAEIGLGDFLLGTTWRPSNAANTKKRKATSWWGNFPLFFVCGMLAVPRGNLGHPGLEAGLKALVARVVEVTAGQLRRHRSHGGQLVLGIVRVLVALAVVEVFH